MSVELSLTIGLVVIVLIFGWWWQKTSENLGAERSQRKELESDVGAMEREAAASAEPLAFGAALRAGMLKRTLQAREALSKSKRKGN